MNPHVCKFFIYQIKMAFEPLDGSHNTYRSVEYAYSGCNCGKAVKTVVTERLKDE
jgi:hypothetical protein